MYENLEVDHIFRIVEDDADGINQISSIILWKGLAINHKGQKTDI